MKNACISRLRRLMPALNKFGPAQSGNVAMLFGLAVLPVMAFIGVAVDYSQAGKQAALLQNSVDSAALGLVSEAGTVSSSQLQTDVSNAVNANLGATQMTGLTVSTSYNSSTQQLTVKAWGSYPMSFMGIFGTSSQIIGRTSVATYAAQSYPICTMITASASNHTLFAGDTSTTAFNGCMVQVNTNNWDAVETDGSAYLKGDSASEFCFVGDIHKGNVTPAKDLSCTFFSDPYANLPIPSTSPCNYNNLNVTANGTVLNPGVYCGNITINASNVTLNPGNYIINGGLWLIKQYSNVTATGVTFVLTGSTPIFNMQDNSSLTITPSTSGTFSGFSFYFDTKSITNSCVNAGDGKNLTKSNNNCVFLVTGNATLNFSGIAYLVGQAFSSDQNSNIIGNPASVISSFMNSHGSSTLTITGSNSVSAALEKASQSGAASAPKLVN